MKTVTVNDELVISIQDICDEIGISYRTVMKHIMFNKIFVIRDKNNGVHYLNTNQTIRLLNILNEKRYNNTIKHKIKSAIGYLMNVKPLIRGIYDDKYNSIFVDILDLSKALTNDKLFTKHTKNYLCDFIIISTFNNNILTYTNKKNGDKYIKYDDAIVLVNYLKSIFDMYSNNYDSILITLLELKKLEPQKERLDKKLSNIQETTSKTTQSNKSNTYSDGVLPIELPDIEQLIKHKIESNKISEQLPKTPKTDDVKTNTDDTNVLSFREYSCGKEIRNNLISLVKKIGKKLDVPTYMLWSFIYEKFFNTYPQLDKKVLDINYRGNYTIIDYIVDVHMICKLEKMINSFDEWIDKPNKTINDYPIM
jgi:hypothetical protein